MCGSQTLPCLGEFSGPDRARWASVVFRREPNRASATGAPRGKVAGADCIAPIANPVGVFLQRSTISGRESEFCYIDYSAFQKARPRNPENVRPAIARRRTAEIPVATDDAQSASSECQDGATAYAPEVPTSGWLWAHLSIKSSDVRCCALLIVAV